MKLFVVVLATAVAMVVAECDSSKYKKIGCFAIDKQAPDNFEEVMVTKETFNIENYKEVLPQLVCDCLEKTKDDYKYFSIGHNGHCLGSMSFHGNRRNNEAGCINAGEHSAGLANHEYVYQIKADAATPIDGGASDFGPWGECSKSCGGGRRSRERACIKPLPNDPGKGCDDLTEVEDCNVQPCPINGGWSLWSEYSKCSASCGKGTQDRSRKCDHPAPQHGGKDCDGKSEQTRTCVLKSCVENAEAISCEDNEVKLSCRDNWALKIKQDSSYYGRKDNDRCTKFYNINWSTDCKTGADKMASRCDGKQSCKFDCSNGVFGDPCKFTKKYCLVKYQCVGYDL